MKCLVAYVWYKNEVLPHTDGNASTSSLKSDTKYQKKPAKKAAAKQPNRSHKALVKQVGFESDDESAAE